jgi:hypothetical protein
MVEAPPGGRELERQGRIGHPRPVVERPVHLIARARPSGRDDQVGRAGPLVHHPDDGVEAVAELGPEVAPAAAERAMGELVGREPGSPVRGRRLIRQRWSGGHQQASRRSLGLRQGNESTSTLLLIFSPARATVARNIDV